MKRLPREALALLAWSAAGWWLPGVAGVWGVFPLLGVLPGLALARALPLERGPLARWALAIAAAPLVTAVLSLGLMRAGLPLAACARMVAVLGAVAALALEWRDARRGAARGDGDGDDLRGAWWVALGGGALVALVMFANPWLRVRGDAWVHGGIVWEIVERGVPPQDPRFAGLTLNYVWVFNHFVALLTSLRDGDPFAFMALSNAACLFATLALGGLLARALWGGGRAALGGALLLGLGYNAGVWMLWPLRLARAFLGHDNGPAELERQLSLLHWNDAEVIFAIHAPESYMASFLDKFLHGTAINVAYLMMFVYLWALVRALDQGAWRAWVWAAAAASGMLLFHGVVGLSVLPVALAALGLAWLLRGWIPSLPARGRLVAVALATGAGILLAAPYTLAISRGWSPEKSGLKHSYFTLDPLMLWTIVSALMVGVWFARRPLARVGRERRGAAAVLALFGLGMVAFASVVTLPLANHVKFVFEAFAVLPALGALAFLDEVAGWRRRLGTLGAAVVFALVMCGAAALTVRGYLLDRGGATSERMVDGPGEAALYGWMRDSLPRDAVVVDRGFRQQVMVKARRQLLLGDFSGPERAAYPLDQVTERRAVMADLYGPGDSLAWDVARLARLRRPAFVLVRAGDFPRPDSTPPRLDTRPDLFRPLYDRDGFVVYHVSPTAAAPAAAPGGPHR